MKHYRMAIFFTLAFLLSWYPWVLALMRGTHTGPNPLGPFVAALIVTASTEGRTGIKTLLGRLIRMRVGVLWYLIVFLLPLAICIVAGGLTVLFGAGVPQISRIAAATPTLPERFLFIFLFIGLGEEPGWRGFALEHLQETYSPLASSLVLAPLWAIWHLPLMGNEFAPHIIPAFLISLFGGTILQTWIYNHTKGSVFIQMLFHSAVNTFGAGLIFPLFTGHDLTLFWYVYSAVWALIAIGVVASKRLKESRLLFVNA